VVLENSIVNLCAALSSWQPDTLCGRERYTNKSLVGLSVSVHDLEAVLNLEYYNTDTPTKFTFPGADFQRVLLWSYGFVSGTAYTLWMIFYVIRVLHPSLFDLWFTRMFHIHLASKLSNFGLDRWVLIPSC
jgi:hypothetical protein